MIQHLLHKDIDKQVWDNCINRSLNLMPYAYSWWLDTVCPGWEALVQDDYKAVMPLTRNKKLGFHYLYQPFFTQQLGVFSPDFLTANEINHFLTAIPLYYRYIDIHLNYENNPTNENFQYTSRKNFTLDLSHSYIQLSSNYHRNCRRNIQKAIHSRFTVKPGPGPSVFTRFVQRHLDKQPIHLGKSFYPTLQKTTSTSIQNGTGQILGVFKPGGDLVAAGWFIQAAGRYIFLVCASTLSGKQNQAMFLLVDHVIREKAGSGLIYDFSGSNIPGVAYFNAGFGASQNTYLSVKRNLLPWPLRLLKK
jgi:hypothetical protein